MRMYLSVQIPTVAGNESIKKGVLPQVMNRFVETYKPEAAYFMTKDGTGAPISTSTSRTSRDARDRRAVLLGAQRQITYCPVMNADDLKKGLESLMAAGATR